MKRLLIKRGDQILRRDIGPKSLTVGRDPACELHFDDPSLSRKHGTFEPTAAGVRFVDLESLNGSWVNFQKVKQAELKPGDTVLMGSLLITYEAPPPPKPAPVEDPSDGTATVIPSPKAAFQPEDADSTLVLSRKEEKPPDTGTMVFRAEAAVPKSKPPDTAVIPAIRPPGPPTEAAVAPVIEHAPPPEPPVDEAPSKWSWTAKHGLMTLSVGLLVYLILALPLVRTLGNALREESLRRGRVLLDLLEAKNAAAVAEGRTRDLEVEIVTREERVKEALLLDLEGKVLAPSSRVDEKFTAIEGIQPSIDGIRTFYLGRRSNGDYVMVKPILDRGRRAGIAALVYEVSTASGSWAVAILLLGFLIMLLAVLLALILGKRFTLEPIGALRDDIEGVVKGDAPRVSMAQGFAELSELARSINRLIERAPAPPTLREPIPAMVVPRSGHVNTSTTFTRDRLITSYGDPVTSTAQGGGGARFWADSNFMVIRAEPEAASIVGSTPESMEGHHVIEAVKDQKLLGVVLDCLNALEDGPGVPVSTDLPTGPISVSAAREGDRVVVSLKRGA